MTVRVALARLIGPLGARPVGGARLVVPGVLLLALVAAMSAGVVGLGSTVGASASQVGSPAWVAKRCQQFATQSVARARPVAGTGERVVVIGDSWSAGLGLRRPAASWPAVLPGRVSVAGFSGSGFSPGSSPCGPVSFADRAAAAVGPGADLVIVEGGLNDVDQSDEAITAGFERLMRVLAGHRVVVVGPASAPARAAGVPRVDRLLRRLVATQPGTRDVTYVGTADLRLPYLRDRLHLTPAGHRAFGAAVARRADLAP